MKILFVSAEVAPFAKVGGLADVAGSLPKALQRLGHEIVIVMPAYRMIEEDSRWNVHDVAEEIPVSLNPVWSKTAYVKQTEWFTESDRSERVYQPGSDQYLFFASAVLEACRTLDWMPDVVHCNDWHTGFVPVVMREKQREAWDRVGAVFTIHNLAYQGEFGFEILDQLGLPHHLFNPHQLETYGAVNFLKTGAVFADQVNTVSPQYAQEIQTPEFGCRLEGLMAHLDRLGRLSGILNGIDTDVFDPESDVAIAENFSARAPAGKAACVQALREELGLPKIEGAPIMGVVSRLSDQKGIDLVLRIAERLFELPAQLVVLGTGDPGLAEQLGALEMRHPSRIRFIERFDVALAQRIYAGSDIFLMPSSFEPCGLGQLIALRYGTIPVVRSTGGLANTVFEGTNGFTFVDRSTEQLMAAASRATEAFRDPARWSTLMSEALRGDYGWERSATEYEKVYRKAIASRRREAPVTA
jgi:starch synthase